MSEVKETIRIGQLELHILLDSADTNNRVVLFEFVIPSGAKVPVPHYHRDVDEVIYGLEGVTTTTIDGKRVEIRAGDQLFIPRGVVHQHDNLHEGAAKTLVVLTPGNISASYFREMSELVKPGLPPDPAAAKEIMLRHGLVPVTE